jgi:hypothetical protein
MRTTKYLSAIAAAAISLTCAATSRADVTVSFIGSNTGSGGIDSAEADFTLNTAGTTLTVTLTDTSTTQVPDITNILSAVLFNSSGGTPVSAALNSTPIPSVSSTGSFFTDTAATGLKVGDGWQYLSGITQSNDGFNSGISSIGLPAFGPSGNLDPANPANEVKLDGGGYGIIDPKGYLTTDTGLQNHGPLIEDSAVFTLSVPSGFSLSQLGNTVSFQFGTSLNENAVTATLVSPMPEPSTMLIAAVGAIGFVGYGLRRRKKS